MTAHRRLGVLVACCVMAMGFVLVPSSARAQSPSESSRAAVVEHARMAAGFSNCRELRGEYKHGVSNRLRGNRWWVKRGATGRGLFCKQVYRQVKAKLDRDNDHIACEA